MKIEEALEICPDFSISRTPDGKVQCGSLLGDGSGADDGKVCRLPGHFRCELVMWKERQALKRLPVISHSRAGGFESCARSFMLGYIAKATQPVRAAWKSLGSAFAVGRAKIDLGQPWEVPKDIPDEPRIKLEEMLRLYERSPRAQVMSETSFSFEHRGHLVRGYVDAISTDGKRLYEWKYAQSDDTYTALTLSRQLSVYLRAFPAIEEAVIAVARKTRHAIGKTETPDGFRERIAKEYEKNAASLITYKIFPRAQFCPDREVDWLIDVGETIKFAQDRGRFPPNYWSCDGCDWRQFCDAHVSVAKLGVHAEGETCSHPDICEAIGKIPLPPTSTPAVTG
jgi:hypothetical protein